MAHARENPPGYNIDETLWESLGNRQLLRRVSFERGQHIDGRSPEHAELWFVRTGIVACDVSRGGKSSRRILLQRGDKFTPGVGARSPTYSAFTRTDLLRLSKDDLKPEEWEKISQEVGDLPDIETLLLDSVKSFRNAPVLGCLPPKLLLDLVKLEGVARALKPGSAPISFSERPGVYCVARGEAQVLSRTPNEHERPLWNGWTLSPGSVYWGPEDIAATEGECVLIHVPQDGIDRFLRSSELFRRSLRHGAAVGLSNASVRQLPQFLMLATADIDAPLGEMTRLLAQSIAGDFGSDVLILTLAGVETPGFKLVNSSDPARPDEATVSLATFKYSDARLLKYHCVCLLIPQQLRNSTTYTYLADASKKINDVTLATRAPLTIALFSATPFGDPPADLDVLRDSHIKRFLFLGGALPDEDPAYPPRMVRVKINLEELRHLAATELPKLSPATRAVFSRLARAVTDREVGIALSGGGAWAFGHVALLEELHQAGIPVDMVSGTSGGALVAAYYCALGREGLARFRAAAPRLDLAVLAAFAWTGKALGWAVQVDLAGRRLRDLDVPFFPIVADLTNGVEFVPRRGSLSLADCVGAASALVPMVSATNFEGRRCIDGVFVNNTGERILAEEGCEFIIASDIIQTPKEPAPPGLVARMLRLSRLHDYQAGTYLLVQSSDARDRFLADCTFRPVLSASSFGDPIMFRLGRRHEDAARPQAEKFVADVVKPLWNRMCLP